MRILYGVQSTGNGHITRARAMARALADQGLSVDYLFSGREADQFFDMEGFGAYRLCQGFTLAIENGRLDTLGTLRRLAPRRFLREVRALDLEPYDLVITDFEPVTAWAARLRHKPSVGIGHQDRCTSWSGASSGGYNYNHPSRRWFCESNRQGNCPWIVASATGPYASERWCRSLA